MKRILLILTAGMMLGLSGCASLQKDISITADDTASSERLMDLENQLLYLDNSFLINGSMLSKSDGPQAELLKQQIEQELIVPHLDKVVEARLLALKGRISLMQQKRNEAQKCAVIAKKKYENDTQLIILQRRLGLLEEDISTYRVKTDSEALAIENAIAHYENGQYDMAAGLFDSVFVNPQSAYKDPYTPLRNKAWELKDVGSAKFLNANEITATQMMLLAQDKPGLLDFYTAGKRYEGRKLFNLLTKAGLLESISNIETTDVKANDRMTRNLSARFLWNIHTQKNSLKATKYSEKYRSRENAKSPVADISIDDPDFDAILGTVENGIMSLSDGKNFCPDELVSALDFESYLNKMK